MRHIFSILVGLILCVIVSCPVLADELKINIGVENGDRATQVVGADIYALIDGKLTEITVSPDKVPFKMNLKTGALRIKSVYATEKQLKAIGEDK